MSRDLRRSGCALIVVLTVAACTSEPPPAQEPRALPTAESPGATAAPTPLPPDAPVTYAEWRGSSLTVIQSAIADLLFEDTQSCTSDEFGFTVSFPASWYANEGGESPGCTRFAPEAFAVGGSMRLVAYVLPTVPIRLDLVPRGGPSVGGEGIDPILSEDVTIAALAGHRSELLVASQPLWMSYRYTAPVDDDPFGGQLFWAEAASPASVDYVLTKAVLDRMMTTLEFEDRPEANRPEDVQYSEKESYPFTVIENAEADALFATPDICTNPVAGYTVTYPDDWYTNTEIGGWPACSWFSPTFYEVGGDPNEVPPEIAIVLTFAEMSFGNVDEPEYSVADQLTVDRFAASRAELIGHTSPNGTYFPIEPLYWYIVTIEERPGDEPTVYARTDFEGAADYVLNKAVLDRIMALIEFDEAP